MPINDPTAVQRRLVSELRAGIAQRDRRSSEVETEHLEAVTRAAQQQQSAEATVEGQLTGVREAVETAYTTGVAAVESQFAAEEAAVRATHASRSAEINGAYDAKTSASEQAFEETRWMVSSVLDDESTDSPKQRLDDLTTKLRRGREHLSAGVESLAEDVALAKQLLQQRRQRHDVAVPKIEAVPTEAEAAYTCCDEAITRGRGELKRLKRNVLSMLFVSWRPIALFLLLSIGLFALCAGLLPPSLLGPNLLRTSTSWLGVTAGGAMAIGVVIMAVLYSVASNRCNEAYQAMLYDLATAELALHSWRYWSDRELRRNQTTFQKWQDARLQQREHTVAQSKGRHHQTVKEATERRAVEQERADNEFATRLQELEEGRSRELHELAERRETALTESTSREDKDMATLKYNYVTAFDQAEERRSQGRQSIAENWNRLEAECLTAEVAMNQLAAAGCLSSDDRQSDTWQLPENVPTAVPIGQFTVGANSASAESVKDEFTFPVVLPFTTGPSLLLQTAGEGRAAAVETLRMAMLQMLTALPAGKVRFTILDPVGLGEQFSSFMHLADYDELLINSRIWTEGAHIEQRLADLTAHMEDVFQTYLRNEYQSIEEYNEFAGEVAEPYHFLVIANFPANFSEIAARRLVSIINSGARCGVHTLISVDDGQPLPHGLELEDLTASGTHLVWRGDHFEFSAAELAGIPLQLEAPPQPSEFSRIVRRAGDLSKNARRVEVSFERIAPNDSELWTKDSRTGIDVPLGRAGATKLQHLRLGRGTSQHVLVAGKTGSGKSTFLHTLITNLALHYGPDEVEMYLVDFKKGVEFKAYANGQLPHARVIAIESDREFGVSVLKRLDQELTDRGELFRSTSVQDIEMFRNASPGERMPRILLLVDEFQEFFTEDDKLSQTASLLLDRLVRQGRAFGIHVLLGSQTLGGAYSLARSTLGQVAVRIALQCSESDAHLILSEDNTAARLLTRPGEAIYNDANGLIDGNHPFQIAWLPDEQRSEKLKRILNLAMRRDYTVTPPIVFEGNVSADPDDNKEIQKLIESFPPQDSPTVARVWLGEPVELREASAVELRHQAGANLLIAGGDAEAATGMLTTCLTSLAYQYPPPAKEDSGETVQFQVLDAVADEPDSIGWQKAVAACGHRVKVGGSADAASVMAQLGAEIDRRIASPAAAPPIYLFVVNLSGFRDLRKDDDDFGSWGADQDKPATASQQFAKILKEGPIVGVHAFLWCDSYNNIARWVGNKLLKELENRVCFRMNANDSSQIIDTPAAGRLGANRAFLYHDATGSLEKFRPYRALLGTATSTKTTLPDPDSNSGEQWDSLEMFSVN